MANASSTTTDHASLDLAGSWQLRLDPDDEGEDGRWYAATLADQDVAGALQLPGSLQEQGFGDDIEVHTPWTGLIIDQSYFTDEKYAPYREPGNIKIPFWLQPE